MPQSGRALLFPQHSPALIALEDVPVEHDLPLTVGANDVSWLVEHFAVTLAAGFAAVAAVHLIGPRALRDAYALRRYPRGFREVTGALLAVAAALLFLPGTRLFGLGVAAFVMFLSATTLLHRGQYRYAAPLIALLFVLIPVSFAGPV